MQAAYLPRGCMQSEELFGCYERLTNVSFKAVNSTQYICVIFFLHIHFDVDELLLVDAVRIFFLSYLSLCKSVLNLYNAGFVRVLWCTHVSVD